MTGKATSTGELNWLLDDLISRVAAVRQAVILSTDGLVVGASQGLSREDAEHLSAVAAGFQSLARGAGRHFGGGEVRQTIVEMESAFLFVTAAGQAPAWPCSRPPTRTSATSRTRWPCSSSGSASTSRRTPGGSLRETAGHMTEPKWIDEEAGQFVRLYALTGGRTRSSGDDFDLIAMVTATREPTGDDSSIGPEQRRILEIADTVPRWRTSRPRWACRSAWSAYYSGISTTWD